MEKILFALCEGPHDVAFLYRILQVNGLQKYSKPIGEFPAPLNKYFASEAAGENLEQLKLDTRFTTTLYSNDTRKTSGK